MIDNDLVQAALLAKANAISGISASFPAGTILEYNYQGTDWTYPCARLQIDFQAPVPEKCPARVEFSWYIFSEKASSKEADHLAGLFVSTFQDLSFPQNNIKFVSIKILENIKAIRADERTWRAQVRCQSMIHAI